MVALLQELVNDTQAASLKECESIEKKLSKMEGKKREAELKSAANEANNFD
jgi:hypothetical protein